MSTSSKFEDKVKQFVKENYVNDFLFFGLKDEYIVPVSNCSLNFLMGCRVLLDQKIVKIIGENEKYYEIDNKD